MILIYMQIMRMLRWTAGYTVPQQQQQQQEKAPCTYFINQTAALLLFLNTMR